MSYLNQQAISLTLLFAQKLAFKQRFWVPDGGLQHEQKEISHYEDNVLKHLDHGLE